MRNDGYYDPEKERIRKAQAQASLQVIREKDARARRLSAEVEEQRKQHGKLYAEDNNFVPPGKCRVRVILLSTHAKGWWVRQRGKPVFLPKSQCMIVHGSVHAATMVLEMPIWLKADRGLARYRGNGQLKA